MKRWSSPAPLINGATNRIERLAGLRKLVASVLLVAGFYPSVQANSLEGNEAGQIQAPAGLVQQIDNLRALPKQTTEDPKLLEQYKRAEAQRIEAAHQEQLRLEAERQAQEEEAQRQRQIWQPVYSGNMYTPGQCTWYVASRRSVPSNWGNAINWLGAARSAGFSTGSVPRVGAIAWSGYGWAGHVAIVDAVSDQGVLISEMNATYGPFNVDQRWASPGEFMYIY